MAQSKWYVMLRQIAVTMWASVTQIGVNSKLEYQIKIFQNLVTKMGVLDKSSDYLYSLPFLCYSSFHFIQNKHVDKSYLFLRTFTICVISISMY